MEENEMRMTFIRSNKFVDIEEQEIFHSLIIDNFFAISTWDYYKLQATTRFLECILEKFDKSYSFFTVLSSEL